MTQIIAAITRQQTFLVSDRRLTWANGPELGKIVEEQECKLVNLCNISAIGYTGLASLAGMPTHEWIGTTIAKRGCSHPGQAAVAIQENIDAALPSGTPSLRRQAFLMSGWSQYAPDNGIHAHMCLISNFHDENTTQMANSVPASTLSIRRLLPYENVAVFAIGEPLNSARQAKLTRNLEQLHARKIGPKEVLRLLVEEVFFTSSKRPTVGDRVLACCIPKRSAEDYFRVGQSRLSGQLPNGNGATFSYFDRKYNENVQYGPTLVCGSSAFTGIRYTKDANGPKQSMQVRVLYKGPAKAGGAFSFGLSAKRPP